MKKISLADRQIIYDHFEKFHDPYFGVVIPFDVSKVAKNKLSIFIKQQ